MTFSSSKLCGPVINSYDGSNQVFGSTTILTVTDSLLESYAVNFTIIGPILLPQCYDTALKFVCGSFFPQCGVNDSECCFVEN